MMCLIVVFVVVLVVFLSECWTKNDPHLVEDDVARCQTVQEEKCVEVKLKIN